MRCFGRALAVPSERRNTPTTASRRLPPTPSPCCLASLRKLVEADRQVRDGDFHVRSLVPMRRTSSLTVDLVGFGRLARRGRSVRTLSQSPVVVVNEEA